MWNLLTALSSFGFLVVAKQASTALVRSFTGQSLTKVKNHHTFYTNEMHVLSASRCARKTISSTYSQRVQVFHCTHCPLITPPSVAFADSQVYMSLNRAIFINGWDRHDVCSVYIYPVYFVTLTDKFVSFSICVCVCVIFVCFVFSETICLLPTNYSDFLHTFRADKCPSHCAWNTTHCTVPFSTFSNSSPNFVGCTSIYFHWKNHFVNQTCSKNLTRRFIHSLYSFRRQLIK